MPWISELIIHTVTGEAVMVQVKSLSPAMWQPCLLSWTKLVNHIVISCDFRKGLQDSNQDTSHVPQPSVCPFQKWLRTSLTKIGISHFLRISPGPGGMAF